MEHNNGDSGSNEGNGDRKTSESQRDSRREESRRGRRGRHGRHRHSHHSHGFGSWGHRKERVLHTRVSDELHEALHRAAEDLRVPVSNFVRNVLEDVTRMVDGVSESVGGAFGAWIKDARARRAAEEEVEETAPRPDFSDVTGWQPILVNRPGPCAACGTALERGEEAYLGLSATGAAPKLLCRDCLDED
jgi:hypothetical protein